MSKQEFLASLNDVYCRIGIGAHGIGVIAIRHIPKGTDPFKRCDLFGDVLKIPEAELEASEAPEEAKNIVRDFCALQDGFYCVPDYGIDGMDKSYYMNHSKDANMTTADAGETFTAARDIQAGEELTADYRLYHATKRFDPN